MQIKMNINNNIETSTVFTGENKFLVIKNMNGTKFVLLPNYLEINKVNDNIILKIDSEDKILISKFKLFND